jgi:hypothetical protein
MSATALSARSMPSERSLAVLFPLTCLRLACSAYALLCFARTCTLAINITHVAMQCKGMGVVQDFNPVAGVTG